MPYVMTYNSLLESIKNWTIKTGDATLNSELPRIVDTAERKVARTLKTLMSVKYATDTLTINNPLVVKPSRWLETISLQIEVNGENQQLYKRTYEYINTVYPNPTDTDVPKYFSDFEFGYLRLGPTPNAAYPFELAYYERPEPLDDATQQNWLTQNAPDLLLYACLLECAPFLINFEQVSFWDAAYKSKLLEFGIEDTRRNVTQAQEVKKPT